MRVGMELCIRGVTSDTEPFMGVECWDRALRLAQVIQGNTIPPLKKFLVAARTDRAGAGVSADRIKAMVQDLDFDRYFETSAKEGHQIAELKVAIQEAIEWELLLKISSTRLF